jgi:hypothetical protein
MEMIFEMNLTEIELIFKSKVNLYYWQNYAYSLNSLINSIISTF